MPNLKTAPEPEAAGPEARPPFKTKRRAPAQAAEAEKQHEHAAQDTEGDNTKICHEGNGDGVDFALDAAASPLRQYPVFTVPVPKGRLASPNIAATPETCLPSLIRSMLQRLSDQEQHGVYLFLEECSSKMRVASFCAGFDCPALALPLHIMAARHETLSPKFHGKVPE